MHILIPMAGSGNRFKEAGYVLPKPLIDVAGKPMIQRVVECLFPDEQHIFIIQEEHDKEYQLGAALRGMVQDPTIIMLNKPTAGAADTTMVAYRNRDLWDIEDELIIANCDQYLEWNSKLFLDYAREGGYMAIIPYFNSTNPHHSYLKMNSKRMVIEVAEKKVISDNAVVGVYWVRKAADYFTAVQQMMSMDLRVNDEFYISPAFNQVVKMHGGVGGWEIDVHKKHMLGTPNELEIFLDKVKSGEVKLPSEKRAFYEM